VLGLQVCTNTSGGIFLKMLFGVFLRGYNLQLLIQLSMLRLSVAGWICTLLLLPHLSLAVASVFQTSNWKELACVKEGGATGRVAQVVELLS
jgi:hypothetical protein